MKNLLLILSSIVLTVSPITAYEQPDNPDRYVSFALDFDKGTLDGSDGKMTEFLFGTTGTLSNEIEVQSIIPSVRIPLTGNCTLDLRVNFHKQEFQYNETLLQWNGTSEGHILGGSLRWYLK